MKKILFLIAILILSGTPQTYAQKKANKSWHNQFTTSFKPQQDAPYIWRPTVNNLGPIVQRKVIQHTSKVALYANNRIRRMCHGFRGCEKWARGKYALDTSLLITDVEIEYFLDKGDWAYTLYVQTIENGHLHAYKLKKTRKGEFFPVWEEIKKFPGHPFAGPSKSVNYPSEEEIYKRWSDVLSDVIGPELKRYGKYIYWTHQVAEEQVVRWENGEPAGWKRTLYARFVGDDENNWDTVIKEFVIVEKQNSLGNSYSRSEGKWKPYIF